MRIRELSTRAARRIGLPCRVIRPERYRWSSDRFYRKEKGPEWLDLDHGLSYYLGARRSEAVWRYRSLRVETLARRVAQSRGVDLSRLRGQGTDHDVSLARGITAHLGKTVGRIPYARTAQYLNRDGSTLTWDVRRLEELLRKSPSLRFEVNRLAGSLMNDARIQA